MCWAPSCRWPPAWLRTLRRAGPWTNHDTRFDGPGASFLAHNHIAGTFRALSESFPGGQVLDKIVDIFRRQ